jgi:minor extracellular serine protease Vpr
VFVSSSYANRRPVNTTYIVFLKDYSGPGERSCSLLATTHNKFKANLSSIGSEIKIENEFTKVVSGFSLNCTDEQIKEIAELPDVEGVYFTRLYFPQLYDAVVSTRAVEAWEMQDSSKNKITGKDVLVGVIDTGISYDHPAFSGDGFAPDKKICVGYDFANLDDDPNPEKGHVGWHGTHCAGIVGATGLAGVSSGKAQPKGIAPDCKLGAYKVFGTSRGARSDRIIAAIERAYADGCKVISLSLGSSYVWSDEPTCILIDKLVAKGLVVVAAAGNEGDVDRKELPYQIISPGGAKDAICVGAVDDSPRPVMLSGNNYFVMNYIYYSKEVDSPITGQIVDCGQASKDDLNDLNLKGKIALVKRGDTAFSDKAKAVEAKGALACVIYNNESGGFGGYLADQNIGIPVLSASDTDGQAMQEIAKQGTTVTLETMSKLGLMAGFSSRGPTNDFRLKPDVSAPGVQVLSSVGVNSYVRMSGTSMATPAVAGACALVLQAHPEWNAYDVRSAIINYAEPQIDSKGNFHEVLAQGTGRIDIIKSINAPAIFNPTSIDLGYSTGDQTVNVAIKNITKQSLKIDIFQQREGKIDKTKIDSVTIAANSKKDVKIKISQTDTAPGPHAGYILFEMGTTIARAGYLYFAGEKPNPPLMSEIEQISKAISPNGDKKADSASYHVSINDRIAGYEISIADKDDKLIQVLGFSYGFEPGGDWYVSWDGMLEGYPVGDGKYFGHLNILPLGKSPSEKANWTLGKPLEFYVDTIPPEIKFTNLSPVVYNQTGTFTLKGKINDFLISPDAMGKDGLKSFNVMVGKTPKIVTIDEDGSFSIDLELILGENNFTFVALDAASNTTTQKITIKSMKKVEVGTGKDGVIMDGKKLGLKTTIQNDTLMVEVSEFSKIVPEILIKIDGKKILVTLDGVETRMMVGQGIVLSQGKSFFCEAPQILDKQVYVDIASLFEAFGFTRNENVWQVVWKGK